jgi:hypothetical protein
MSVEQADVIDFVTTEKESGDVRLIISDHLPWEGNEREHMFLLQEKLNAYLGFIEGGQIFEAHPDYRGRGIVIDIVAKYPPTAGAEEFLQFVRETVEGAGFRLQITLMDQR